MLYKCIKGGQKEAQPFYSSPLEAVEMDEKEDIPICIIILGLLQQECRSDFSYN